MLIGYDEEMRFSLKRLLAIVTLIAFVCAMTRLTIQQNGGPLLLVWIAGFLAAVSLICWKAVSEEPSEYD